MDEADQGCTYGDNEAKGYPEQEEDAWRKRISACPSLEGFGEPGSHSSIYSSSTMWSPPAASSPFKTCLRTKGPLPTEPEIDDLFFTRSPASSTPPHEFCTRKERLEISRAVVSSWFRTVQSPSPEDLEERLASVL
ncbi:hypothetical protein NM688_g8744 [Phlebia brevispora]|uniref:Uncharacterized protein n=1 Tax=Phlebia brevispora TaxID=194682 RepID=A0ACC1RNF9_9APHY|nr:hypothetical protein NM688_g8744 [Phlebia brevispora]